MAIRYVDSSVASSGNGQAWATAWKAIANITGLAAGDIVYFSGGPAGGAGQSYAVPTTGWSPIGGTGTNRITYQIGQDSAHNGIATFVHANAFLINCDNVVISGDAGDGQMHFKLQSGGGDFPFNLTGHSGWRLSYINGGSACSRTWIYAFGNGTQNFEVDHCFFHKLTEVDDDAICYFSIDAARPYDDTKIHHNEFHCPRRAGVKPDGFGDDFFAGKNWSGVSFYNNKLLGYSVGSGYLGGQHQDGSQPLGGDRIKWYNNYAQDVSNYPFYGDAFYAGFTNLYVFNNIIAIVDSGLRIEDSPQGISVGSEMNNAPFSNIIVTNNIIVDYGQHYAINVGDGGSGTIAYGANVGLWNNIATNNTNSDTGHPTFGNSGNPGVTNINNVNLAIATGAGIWTSYVQNRADIADFHLLATATQFIGHGTNLSSNAAQCPEIQFDRDGVQRPTSGAWDIGPYQYVSGGGGGGVVQKASIGILAGAGVGATSKVIRPIRASLR